MTKTQFVSIYIAPQNVLPFYRKLLYSSENLLREMLCSFACKFLLRVSESFHLQFKKLTLSHLENGTISEKYPEPLANPKDTGPLIATSIIFTLTIFNVLKEFVQV